ncbi:hypothetical protein E1A91_D10G194200v1 [Gossypium mustelinum]|uniref:Uncharacterized protein n=1 Tax=Gossypium mustelinum TaxID=34275 RepID=A0A5D2T8T1_GOSMU|nr:hypothetical protein E1A91_D10G194200v1 [Gossypium mustelinum]
MKYEDINWAYENIIDSENAHGRESDDDNDGDDDGDDDGKIVYLKPHDFRFRAILTLLFKNTFGTKLLFSTKFSTHSHFPQIKNPRNSFPPNFLRPRCHSPPILTTTSSLTLVLSLSRPKLITSSPSFRRQKMYSFYYCCLFVC